MLGSPSSRRLGVTEFTRGVRGDGVTRLLGWFKEHGVRQEGVTDRAAVEEPGDPAEHRDPLQLLQRERTGTRERAGPPDCPQRHPGDECRDGDEREGPPYDEHDELLGELPQDAPLQQSDGDRRPYERVAHVAVRFPAQPTSDEVG